MADIAETLNTILKIDGAFACALADHDSGMTLGTAGGQAGFDIELAAAGNTAVVRAKLNVMNSLQIDGGIEDILITLDDQYHLIRPLKTHAALFLYLAIDKAKGNLALARHRLGEAEKALVV